MIIKCVCLGFLVTSVLAYVVTNNKRLSVGVLLQENDLERSYIIAALKYSKQILDKILVKHGYELHFEYGNSGCTDVKSAGAAATLTNIKHVHALLGPSCSEGCLSAGLIAAYENVPMVSFGCSTGIMSDLQQYPTFARTKPYARTVPNYLRNIISNLLGKYDWKQVGIVYSNTERWIDTFEQVYDVIVQTNYTRIAPLIQYELYPNILDIVDRLKQSCRVILLIIQPEDVAQLLSRTYEVGMHNGDYSFITIDFLYDDKWNVQPWFSGPIIFEGTLNIGVKSARQMLGENQFLAFENQLHYILAIMDRDVKAENLTYHSGAAYAFDAAKAYVQALDLAFQDHQQKRRLQFLNVTKLSEFLLLNNLTLEVLDEIHTNISLGINSTWTSKTWIYPTNWTYTNNITLPTMNYTYEIDFDKEDIIEDGKEIVKFILNANYEGFSGEVHLNKEGDRFPILKFDNLLLNRTSHKIDFKRTFEFDEYYNRFTDFTNERAVVWPGGGIKVPLSIPECGFTGELCESASSLNVSNIVIGVLSPFVLVGVGFFLYRMYRQNKYEKDLLNQDMLFKFPEIEIPVLIAKQMQEEMKKKALLKKNRKKHTQKIDYEEFGSQNELIVNDNTKEIIKPERKRQSVAKATFDDVLLGLGNLCPTNMCENFKGKFRMDTVFIKRLPKSQVLVTRETLIEMKEIRDLKHANLNPVLGFCIGPPYVLMCSSYCNKGSLKDVLSNSDIQIDWVIRNTFISDVIQGLIAIHESSMMYHGHLTSTNVLIDNRWNCKITDYGLFKFRDLSQEIKHLEMDEEAKYEALVWTSPENINFPFPRKSKEGDIYSLGIIMAEIINRAAPYYSYPEYTARDFVHFVHKRCIPPFRPHVRLLAGLDGRTLDLMRLCWDEFPENRPSIQSVKATFKTIFKDLGESNNLLDNMIEMMEKYAHNLELDAKERTNELKAERERAETLFYRALPKSIAEMLRKGQNVETKSTEAASVLCFEVDDFNHFMTILQPQQLVDVLHDLHKVIEISVMEEQEHCSVLQFNRDSVAIVSGMPEPIKVKHAHYLAKTAIRIMGQLTTFRFRHIKDTDMRFKMSLHSGQFSYGIIGLKVPVFSCMGIEMEKAIAMCKVAPPLRILVSPGAKKYLDKSLKTAYYEKSGPLLLKALGVVDGHYLKNIRSLGLKLRDPRSVKQRKSSTNPIFQATIGMM